MAYCINVGFRGRQSLCHPKRASSVTTLRSEKWNMNLGRISTTCSRFQQKVGNKIGNILASFYVSSYIQNYGIIFQQKVGT